MNTSRDVIDVLRIYGNECKNTNRTTRQRYHKSTDMSTFGNYMVIIYYLYDFHFNGKLFKKRSGLGF